MKSTGFIYCLFCLNTGKKYIGKTTQDIQERIFQHKSSYKRKYKTKLYNAIAKHGWDSFIWGMIEECEIKNINEREKYWIEKFDTYKNGYNSTLGGDGSSNPKKWKSVRLINPNGELIEEKNISLFCNKYKLQISSISLVLSGKRKSHKGWKLGYTDKTKYSLIEKPFKLKSPDGKVIQDKNIRKFCIENNLDASTISKVLLGKRKSHKGWTLP